MEGTDSDQCEERLMKKARGLVPHASVDAVFFFRAKVCSLKRKALGWHPNTRGLNHDECSPEAVLESLVNTTQMSHPTSASGLSPLRLYTPVVAANLSGGVAA